MLKKVNISFKLFLHTIVILLYVASFVKSKRQVKIRNFNCEVIDLQLGKFSRCNVKPIRRDVSEINVHFKLKRPVDGDFLLNLFVNKRGNTRMPTLYNFSIDCCKFLQNRKKHPNYSVFFKMLGFEAFSNVNHTCPYKEDVYIKGYRMDEQYIRFIPVPYGEYVMSLHWYHFKKLVVRNDISFVFFEKVDIPHRNYTKRTSNLS